MSEFTVEEENLISIYEGQSRTDVIQEIKAAMKYIGEGELLELSERVIRKLETMRDEEFEGVEIIAAVTVK